MKQSSVARLSDISVPSVPQILDSSGQFSIYTPEIDLTDCSIEPDNSIVTAHFKSPQSSVHEYAQQPVQHSETLRYDGKTISANPKILKYGTCIMAYPDDPHKNRMDLRTIDTELYEAVLKHYLTECVSKVLPKITNGIYISDNKPLPKGAENKEFPGLFLAYSEKPIDDLVKGKIISNYFNSEKSSYDDMSMISDYLKEIEGKDGICLVTKGGSGVDIALSSSLLNISDVDSFEKYFPYPSNHRGAKTKAALYAATLLDEPMNVILIKQSTCSDLGVGKMIVLNAQGVERDVCVEYSPTEANKEACMKKGYNPSPEDLLVVETSFARNEQGKLAVKETTRTPLSDYFELFTFNYAPPEVKKDDASLFDEALLGACY